MTHPFHLMRAALPLPLAIFLAHQAKAQDVFYDLPSPSTGFYEGIGFLGDDSGLFGELWDGISLSTSFSGRYNSNVTQSPGGAVAPIEDDFIFSLGGNINYRTQGRDWVFGGNYRATYDEYMNRSELSGLNQGANLITSYTGNKLTATATINFNQDRGANRYYSSFVESINTSYGLSAKYRLSPKTAIASSTSYSRRTANRGNFGDTSAFNFSLSGLWKHSPLTEFGPGFRYALRTGTRQGDRSSIGPTLTLNYRLTSKVSVNSRIGMEFVDYEDDNSSDPSFFTSISVNYRASALWGMNLSLHRDTQADPAIRGGYYESTDLRIGYHRKIRRATLNLGAGYSIDSFENAQGTATRSDRDYLTLSSSISLPLFRNTTSARLYLNYREQTSRGAGNSWDGYETGFNISRKF